MKERVDTVIEEIQKNKNSKIIITWYKNEIKYILGLFSNNWLNINEWLINGSIIPVLSYDTLTNILNVSKKTNRFNDIDKIIFSTSESHAIRIKTIFEKYFPDIKIPIEVKISKESEVYYADLASKIYRVFNPRILQYASIAFRPLEFTKQYLIPTKTENLESYILNLPQ